MENLRWIAAAALSAYACHLTVHHPTPVDAALPLLGVAVTLLAWMTVPSLMLGVPLLLVAEMAIADEGTRLLAFGAILASCVAVAMAARPPKESGALQSAATPLVAVIAVVLLRWIPLRDVQWGREVFLLLLTASIVVVLGRTPLAVAIGVITALLTPAMPLRTLLIAMAVLIVAAGARTFGLPALRLTWPSCVLVSFVMLFFAWSGVVARAFPYFLRAPLPQKARWHVGHVLPASDGREYDVPQGAKALILSGANVARLRRGAVLGRIEPGGIAVRIGDVADWGYLRRDAWYQANNPLPRQAVGRIRDYGYGAWIDGAGRIALPEGVRGVRVTADASLPAGALLQVEGFELE